MTSDLREQATGAAARTPASRSTGESLIKAAVAGLVAGGVFIGLTMWFATSQGRPPLAPLKLIATLVVDGPAKELGGGGAWIGAGVHAVLSALFGLVFGLVTPWLRRHDVLLEAGLAYGGLIYLVNFQILARIALPQFRDVNQPVEASLHLLFGAVLAAALLPNVLHRSGNGGNEALRWAAAVASSGVLLIHFATAGRHLEEEVYIGVLFVVASTLLTAGAILLTRRDDRFAWMTGAIVHAGLFLGLPLSRTIGLPSYSPSNWPTLGTETLVLEGVYLLLFAMAVLRWRRRDQGLLRSDRASR